MTPTRRHRDYRTEDMVNNDESDLRKMRWKRVGIAVGLFLTTTVIGVTAAYLGIDAVTGQLHFEVAAFCFMVIAIILTVKLIGAHDLVQEDIKFQKLHMEIRYVHLEKDQWK